MTEDDLNRILRELPQCESCVQWSEGCCGLKMKKMKCENGYMWIQKPWSELRPILVNLYIEKLEQEQKHEKDKIE